MKHLSKQRKRKSNFYFPSSGERKGKSLNQTHNLLCIWSCKKIMSGVFLINRNAAEGEHLDEIWLAEIPWKGIPKMVIVQ
ncbi:MAG: hypothetical protein COV63_01520 [Candidatus Nealsonbacteria bacterium CG11_big_fil_rev_8_21_14_0_20_37_68]|nr:MAG: hypothetical protein COV63_01520 [Candidatus Nealsonbacteria bacterium CG11_big_fil_rev_8_21_14_0_20_37_68]